jgi:hypothetical protein
VDGESGNGKVTAVRFEDLRRDEDDFELAVTADDSAEQMGRGGYQEIAGVPMPGRSFRSALDALDSVLALAHRD